MYSNWQIFSSQTGLKMLIYILWFYWSNKNQADTELVANTGLLKQFSFDEFKITALMQEVQSVYIYMYTKRIKYVLHSRIAHSNNVAGDNVATVTFQRWTSVSRSWKQSRLSTNVRQRNRVFPGGHGRLLGNLDAVASSCCATRFSTCPCPMWPIWTMDHSYRPILFLQTYIFNEKLSNHSII
jgi:hypothetical protein